MDLQRTLLNNYPFNKIDQWSGIHIAPPQSLGNGGLNIFEHNGLQFMRSSWNFHEKTIFRSPDPVGNSDLIDFRIGKSGEVRSAYLEGCDTYEWEISKVDGMRLMVPLAMFSEKKLEVLNKFQKYTFNRNIERVIRDLFDTSVNNYMDCVKMEWKFLELSFNWLDFFNNRDISRNFPDIPDSQIRAIQEATYIIKSNLTNPPQIKELGKLVGLNQQYLKSTFKKLNGLSIYQFIIRERMTLARDLVEQDTTPICEISRIVGYNNPGHFANLYKKFHGVNPLHHRKTIQ